MQTDFVYKWLQYHKTILLLKIKINVSVQYTICVIYIFFLLHLVHLCHISIFLYPAVKT